MLSVLQPAVGISVAVLALSASPRGEASAIPVGPVLPAAGPALVSSPAPNGVMYARPLRGGGFQLVASDGVDRIVGTFARDPLLPNVALELTAAPGAYAFAIRRTGSSSSSMATLQLLSGDPAADRAAELARCPAFEGFVATTVDADADRILVPAPDCHGGFQVFELSAAGGSPVAVSPRLASSGFMPRIAGPYFAALEGPSASQGSGSVVVRRWADGSELVRVDSASLGASITDMDLAADGRIVIAAQRRAGERKRETDIFTTTPGAGQVIRLAPQPSDTYAVRAGQNGFAFARGRQVNAWIPHAELGFASYDGALHVIARDRPVRIVRGFDFDGQQIAWPESRCYSAVIEIALVSSSSDAPAAHKCALAFRSKPRLTRGGVRITIDCSGFASYDCRGRVAVAVRSGGRWRHLAVRAFAGERRITVPLTRAGRRLVSRHPRLRLTAAITDARLIVQRRRATATVTR